MTKKLNSKSIANPLSGNLGSLIGEDSVKNTSIADTSRPMKRTDKMVSTPIEENKPEPYHRVTIIMTEEDHENLKRLAHWTRSYLKDTVADAIDEAIAVYEKKYGKLEPIPEEKQRRKHSR